MRKISLARIITLTLLLAATALSVHGIPDVNSAGVVRAPLEQVLGEIPGWRGGESYEMGDQIVEALRLDDHLFRAYQRDRERVTLYIGFYRSAGKVGAAHDPLVCFTGQGWRLDNRSRGNHTLTTPGLDISYSTMIAERQGERQLLLYWFQTNGNTSADTLSQKVAMVWDRFKGRGEENAFVRLSTTIGNESPEAARKRLFAFVESFYPVLHRYLTGI